MALYTSSTLDKISVFEISVGSTEIWAEESDNSFDEAINFIVVFNWFAAKISIVLIYLIPDNCISLNLIEPP